MMKSKFLNSLIHLLLSWVSSMARLPIGYLGGAFTGLFH